MKYSIQLMLLALFVLVGCGKSAEHTDHEDHEDDMEEDGPNQALYNQVNELHETVMFKMEDLFKLKGQLLEKIANTPGMPAEQKKDLEGMVASLDSADHAMRDWMHGWMNNVPDSADQEKTREYFESEMEKIKKVNELTDEAIVKAKEEVNKK